MYERTHTALRVYQYLSGPSCKMETLTIFIVKFLGINFSLINWTFNKYG